MESPTTIWSKFTLFSEAAGQAIAQVVGTLVFDSNMGLAPVAVRRSPSLESRRLVYQADLLTICIELQDAGDGQTTYIGQIVPGDSLPLSRVELWGELGNQPAAIGAVSRSGYFRFEGVRPATYTLVLRSVVIDLGTALDSTSGEIMLGPITLSAGLRA